MACSLITHKLILRFLINQGRSTLAIKLIVMFHIDNQAYFFSVNHIIKPINNKMI